MKEVTKTLLEVSNVKSNMRQVFKTIDESIESALKNFSDSGYFNDEILENIKLAKECVDMERIYEQIGLNYEKHFSQDELERMVSIYSDPVMQKFTSSALLLKKETDEIVSSAINDAQSKFLQVSSAMAALKNNTAHEA